MIYWLYILSLFALWLFYKSYASYRDRGRLVARGIEADAYISEIQEEEEVDAETGKKYITKIPFMTYKDKSGKEHTYRISTTSDFAKYHLHEKYKLVYDPDGEYEPLIMTRLGMWGDVIGFIAAGVFVILWLVWSSKGVWW